MVQMLIMILSLISIMDTGNRILIICPDPTEKMFPFTEVGAYALPVGNRKNIEILLDSLADLAKDITLLGVEGPEVKSIAKVYGCQLYTKSNNILQDIFEITREWDQGFVFWGDGYYNEKELRDFIISTDRKTNAAMVCSLSPGQRSIDYICANADEEILSFIAHAREHYVNVRSCQGFALTRECLDVFPMTQKGFSSINCGQMPPEEGYFVENALQKFLQMGGCIKASYLTEYVKLEFPWDLREANHLYTENIVGNIEEWLGKDAYVDESCIIEGKLYLGNRSKVLSGTIIEGNCLIGDDVTIEKNVIVGKNCVIGDGTVLKHGCKIVDNTIIGKNNKIGFSAEVSGVTMEGVCAVHNCEVFGVIGKYVDIAAGVQMAVLKFDDSHTVQRVQGKKYENKWANNILIGNYTRTGIGNLFYPGVRIGSRSALGPGLIVSEDIPHNTLAMPERQSINNRPWGSERYGW